MVRLVVGWSSITILKVTNINCTVFENTATRTIIVGTHIMQGKAAVVKKCVILLRRTHYIKNIYIIPVAFDIYLVTPRNFKHELKR